MFDVSLRMILEDLSSQNLIVGLILAGAGLVFIILGGRIFRGLVTISFGVLGFFIGVSLPVSGPAQLLLGTIGTIGLSALSCYWVKGSVGALAGLWAAAIVFTITRQFGMPEQVPWALAGFTVAAVISLTFIMFEEIVAFVTSLEGSLLLTGALVIFFSQNVVVWSHIRSLMLESRIFVPFMILAGTVSGYYFQITDVTHKDTGVTV